MQTDLQAINRIFTFDSEFSEKKIYFHTEVGVSMLLVLFPCDN